MRLVIGSEVWSCQALCMWCSSVQILAVAMLISSCSTQPASTPEPTTTGTEVLQTEPSTQTSGIVWHTIDNLGDEGRYVILGGTDVPESEGRLLDAADVDLFLHESGGEVPTLTLVGYEGQCVASSARRVVIVQQIDPSDPYRSAFDAVAVTSECEPVLAVEGNHPDARVVPLDISDTEFGEPIVATGEGWSLRFEYGPSEDGICPGFPLRTEVSRNGEMLLSRDFDGLLDFVRLVTVGDRAWLLLGELERATLIELGGDDERRFDWPSGVDLAQTC